MGWDGLIFALCCVNLCVELYTGQLTIITHARKRTGRHHTESLNAGGPGVEEEEGEGEEDEEAAATTTAAGVANSAGAAAGGTAEGQGAPASNANVVPELVARSWERTRRQAALEAHVKGACAFPHSVGRYIHSHATFACHTFYL